MDLLRADTQSVRIGERNPDAEWPRPETMPVYQTSVFTFTDLDDVIGYYETQPEGRYLYTRSGNPNVSAVEAAVASLEGAEAAVCAATGMGALSGAIMAVCKAGDRVILSQDIYGGTLVLLRSVLQPFGVRVDLVDLTDLSALRAALVEKAALVIGESISNPLVSVIDIGAVADIVHAGGAKLLIDNTFATPLLVQPLHHGADIVVHSATKYLGGHSDVSGGVVCGSKTLMQSVRMVVTTLGASLAPYDAWLIARGIKTFPLRFPRQCDNAQALATWFANVPGVRDVYYPTLATHPSCDRASLLCDGRGGAIISIRLPDDKAAVNAFMRALPHIPFAPSLAGVNTTLSHPWTTSHRGFSEAERTAFGISMGLVRISVGIEHVDDLQREFSAALTAVFGE